MLNSAVSTSTSSSCVAAAGKSSDTTSDSSAVPSPVSLSLSPVNMESMSPPQPLSSKSDSDPRGMKVSGRGVNIYINKIINVVLVVSYTFREVLTGSVHSFRSIDVFVT